MWTSNGRLLLGMESPIALAVLVLEIAPWLLLLTDCATKMTRPTVRSLAICIVVGVCALAISLSQTRSVIIPVAIVAAAAYVLGRQRRLGAVVISAALTALGILVLGTLFGATGKRMLSVVAGTDESSGNRLDVWRASADALLVNPISGIGGGEAGNFVSQWFLPDSNPHQYATVFSTLVQTAIEYGAAIAVLGVFLVIFLVRALAAISMQTGSSVACACCASLIGWVIGSSANSFLELSAVSGVAAANVIIALLVSFCRRDSVRSSVCSSAAIAVAFVTCVYGGAYSISKCRYRFLVDGAGGTMIVSDSRPKGPAYKVTVLIDTDLLGPLYGRELRRWFDVSKMNIMYVPHPKRSVNAGAIGRTDVVVLVGKTQRFYKRLRDALDAGVRFIFVHPDYPIDDNYDACYAVQLPVFCDSGVESEWRKTVGARITRSGAEAGSLRGKIIKFE